MSGARFEGASLGAVFWLHTRLAGEQFSGDYAEKMREHFARVRAAEEREREKERLRLQELQLAKERLAREAFGEGVQGQAGRLLGISLVKDHQAPEALTRAAAALVEQERLLVDVTSKTLVFYTGGIDSLFDCGVSIGAARSNHRKRASTGTSTLRRLKGISPGVHLRGQWRCSSQSLDCEQRPGRRLRGGDSWSGGTVLRRQGRACPEDLQHDMVCS